jgi:hypothetical protein
LAFHDRHTGAFSCAIPINTTRPSPPAAAAASINGAAMASLLCPFSNRITGTCCCLAHRCTSATYASPIFPNAADDGITYPRCQRRNWHTQPTVCNFGT